jgi:hypothetical protein
MSDLIERLRTTHAEVVASDGGECEFISLLRLAADEIGCLRGKVAEWKYIADRVSTESNRRGDEIERLRAEKAELLTAARNALTCLRNYDDRRIVNDECSRLEAAIARAERAKP